MYQSISIQIIQTKGEQRKKILNLIQLDVRECMHTCTIHTLVQYCFCMFTKLEESVLKKLATPQKQMYRIGKKAQRRVLARNNNSRKLERESE